MRLDEREEVMNEDFLEKMTDEQVKVFFKDDEGTSWFKNKREFNLRNRRIWGVPLYLFDNVGDPILDENGNLIEVLPKKTPPSI